MTYEEARVYLDEVSKYGSVLGLDTIRELLYELGNPQNDLKFIHIAGTNGKGSVLAYISTILSETGFRVGRYVSPTVIGYLEKIQINGNWISEKVFTELVEEVQRAIVRMETNGKASPTVFEVETAIAFLYFQREHCDYVVLETGLGGILDATNIISNTKVAVFTNISRDHMGFLGNTLEEIAENKAGIIKPGCVVVSAAQEEAVRKVLKEAADKNHVPIQFAEPDKVQVLDESYHGQTFSYKQFENIHIPLAGLYQIQNAATACEVLLALQRIEQTENKCEKTSKKSVYSMEAIRNGFLKTKWKGRFTCIHENPVFIVDGAHNEDAAKQLKKTLERYFPQKQFIFIMGVFKDKEYEKIVQIMLPLAKKVYTINLPNKDRTLDADLLKQVIEKNWEATATKEESLKKSDESYEVCSMPSLKDTIDTVMCQTKEDDIIVAFGSLSYLGDVMRLVGKEEKIEK